MGYVYLIEDENNKTYKIGVTRNKNSNRLKKLQTGNSTELHIIYIFETQYPFRLESMLHNNYKNFQVLNEWYKLDENQIEEFPKKCELFNKNIITLKSNPYFNKKPIK